MGLSGTDAAETRLATAEQMLALALRAARLGVYHLDPRTSLIEWDARTRELWGVGEHEQIDWAVFEAGVHPDDRDTVAEAVARAFDPAGDHRYEADYRVVHRTSGRTRWVRALGDAFFENGEPSMLIGTVADITEQRRADEERVDRERLLRRILDGALAFIGVLDPDGTVREANSSALLAGGISRSDVVGRKFWDCYWWNHDPQVQALCRTMIERAAAGEAGRTDVEVRMAGDTRIVIDYCVNPVRGSDGQIELLVPSGVDVSDRRRQEDQVRLLMREVNHRSKNMLAVVRAIARQTQRSGGPNWAERFAERLDGLAAAHDLLVRGQWTTVQLEELVRSQLRPFADLAGGRVSISGAPLAVGAQAAQAIAMALHELSTNAYKYGALSVPGGTVSIAWSDFPGSDGGGIELVWRETGGPTVVAPDQRGFGTTVLDTMTRRALSGDVAFEFAPDGVSWRVHCSRAALAR